MKYILKIERIVENDDFDIYANALVKDIERIKAVCSVIRDNDLITIYKPLKEIDLKKDMEKYFSQLFDFIRYVSLKKYNHTQTQIIHSAFSFLGKFST